MKRVTRLQLPQDVITYLDKKQLKVNNGGDVEIIWMRSRKTEKIKRAHTFLKKKSGRGAYCMYCRCSAGNEIEHYRPKKAHRHLAFNWENLLLSCSECNRNKGDNFKLVNNKPLFLNPTDHTPWEHIDVDTQECILFGITPIGNYTCEILKFVERDTIRDKFRDDFDAILDNISYFLIGSITQEKFIRTIFTYNQVNLLEWLFIHKSNQFRVVQEIQENHSAVFEEIVSKLNSQ